MENNINRVYDVMKMAKLARTLWLPYRHDGTVADELTVPSRIYVLIYGKPMNHCSIA